MKKILLFTIAAAFSLSGIAQTTERIIPGLEDHTPMIGGFSAPSNAAHKTSKLSDTLILLNNSYAEIYDTSIAGTYDQVLPFDTGYYFGTSIFGNTAFAEQYNRSYKADTTLRILGVFAIWAGTINPASTNSINIRVWNRGAQTAIGAAGGKKYTNGFPNTAVLTLNRSVKAIGIGPSADTFKQIYFPTPLTGVTYPFYIGYDYAYSWTALNADTFTIRTSRGGKGNLIGQYTLSGTDTILTTRNAIRNSAGVWRDAYIDLGFVRNISMTPLIRFQSSVSVSGITQNNLTFFGNYPNPAKNKTNVKFALSTSADVTIQVVDLNGRLMSTVKKDNVGPGTHEISISTTNLPAGLYAYRVMTSDGDAMASQLTVVK